MATITDTKGNEWQVALNVPLVDDIRTKHSVDLLNLESDPLVKLRNDPMTLVAVVYLICEEQITERQIDPVTFGRSMPSPPDALLAAVRDSIVQMFPSSRADHVRTVLAKFDEMAAKTDALALTTMQKVLDDPKTAERLQGKADRDRVALMDKFFPLTDATL